MDEFIVKTRDTFKLEIGVANMTVRDVAHALQLMGILLAATPENDQEVICSEEVPGVGRLLDFTVAFDSGFSHIVTGLFKNDDGTTTVRVINEDLLKAENKDKNFVCLLFNGNDSEGQGDE